MLTLMTAILATALLAQSADSIFLSGIVVEAAGKPLSDVEVVLPARRPLDGPHPTLAHTMTDEKGAFRLEVPRQQFQDIALVPFICAYGPGRIDSPSNRLISLMRQQSAKSRHSAASAVVSSARSRPFKASRRCTGRCNWWVRFAQVMTLGKHVAAAAGSGQGKTLGGRSRDGPRIALSNRSTTATRSSPGGKFNGGCTRRRSLL